MPPLLSIVSASWNQGKYLEQCIKSLGDLDPDIVEHIVIDNCSDDETHEVLGQYPHVKAIIEPDTGQSNALNKGFRAARGEWVLWLNVDDFLMPGALAFLCEMIRRKGGDYDMIYGFTVFVDGNGKKMRTVVQPQWRYWMTKWGGFAAPSTGSIFRRSLLVENPLDEDFHMIMDTEWMLRVGGRMRVKRVLREIVCFRIADNKTADHIQNGIVTPRHREERNKLVEKYPCYYGEGGQNGGLLRLVRRKFIRMWVLGDKFLSKIRARSGESENQELPGK